VANTLGGFANSVRVEGHTDDVPIHNLRFASNWDLSAARASRVVEFLIARGLNPTRLSATGLAEFHPRVANTSPENRASNRRIDLVILNATTTSAEEPSASGASR
jgi:chemotaxis protein MotB